jgi:hypothetical protein
MALTAIIDAESQESGLDQIAVLLRAIIDKLPYLDPTNAAARIQVQNTPPVTITSGTVSAVTALNNITSIGSWSANGDQFVQWQIPAGDLRSRITVS